MKPTKKTYTIWSDDFGAFVLAQKILKKSPKINLNIYVKTQKPDEISSFLSETNTDIIQLKKRGKYDSSLLVCLANEGYSDSIEFRRIARKILRKVKQDQHPSKNLLITDLILCETKTARILSHIAGPNLKLNFITKNISHTPNEGEKRNLKIYTGDTKEFTHKIAEKIFKEKISKDSIETITNQ